MELKRDSDFVNFLINFFIAEALFFIGSTILVIVKMIFSLDMETLLEGTFLGSSSSGLFSEAFSPEQINWISTNIFLWWINIFIALFSSLLLIIGFFAVAILLPLGVDIFSGGNPIAVESMPLGFLFLFCWGIFPLLYVVRSTWIGWFEKIQKKFSPST
ncbi:MAG: hypothetical protein ACW964_04535 [Candidatus Hodarchaeales archaeon]